MNDRANPIGQSAIAAIDNPSPALFLHCALFLTGSRIVSDETFRLTSFQGQESASEPFEYQLELHGNTSIRHGVQLKFEEVIGRSVTVGIQYPSGYSSEELRDRFQRAIRGGGSGNELSLFNGIVASFSMEIPGVYRITMRPALWRLSLTNRYCVHRQKNIRDAIADLLDLHRIPYSMDAVSGDDNLAIVRIQDWLQAGETDFDFVRRLMSKAHLYYYFTHTGNSHKLVFANRPAYPQVFADRKPLRYTFTAEDELGKAQSDVIFQYSYQRSMVSSSVRGVFTRQEAAWEEDAVAQFQSFEAASQPNLGELPFNQYKIYQYGCSNEEVRHFTDATSEAMAASGSQFSGSSYCAHFRAGHQFGVTGAVMADSNPVAVRPSLEGQRFVLTQVKHQATLDGGYQNEFAATEATGFISTFSIQETQQGAVLAKVVAHAGDTPPQDWRYYTKDYFDPGANILTDTEAAVPKLNATGVYVRFSTDEEESDPVWVKLAPHMQTVPEIGVTVLVSRAQDESELPEIQSIIQANGSMVVMPSGWTANTHVGSNYSTSYGDGKSIRFGKNSSADLDFAVNIVSTFYNSGKYRETGYSQGAGYSYSAAESRAGSASNPTELYGPYAGAADLMNASESFGSSYSRQYATVVSGFSNIGTSYNKSTIGKSESYTTIDGTSYSENVHNGKITSKTTINADSESESTQTGNTTNTSKITGDTTTSNTHIGKVDSTTSITGNSVSTTTQTGSSTSSMDITGDSSNTSTHHGNVTSTTEVFGNSSNTSTHHGNTSSSTTVSGTSSSTSAIAVSTSSDAIGVSNRNSVVGITNGNSLTGVSANFNLTGASSDVSVTGASSQIGATGASLSVSARGSSLDVSVVGNAKSVTMVGSSAKVEIHGPGIEFISQGTTMKYNIAGLDISLISAIKMIL